MVAKKVVLGLLVASALSANGWALTYTGNISDGAGATVRPDPASPWDDAVLSWTVTQVAGGWQYVYTWSDPGSGGGRRNVSHFSLEVSGNFTAADLLSWEFSSAGGTIKSLEGPKSHGELAGTLYGYKWETAEYPNTGIYDFTLTLVSTRMPMWGDFFLKDGEFTEEAGADKTKGAKAKGSAAPSGDNKIWFSNAGFGFDTTAALADGNAGGWVLVPDTKTGDTIPEPGTMVLLGSGLIGLARFGRSRIGKS